MQMPIWHFVCALGTCWWSISAYDTVSSWLQEPVLVREDNRAHGAVWHEPVGAQCRRTGTVLQHAQRWRHRLRSQNTAWRRRLASPLFTVLLYHWWVNATEWCCIHVHVVVLSIWCLAREGAMCVPMCMRSSLCCGQLSKLSLPRPAKTNKNKKEQKNCFECLPGRVTSLSAAVTNECFECAGVNRWRSYVKADANRFPKTSSAAAG